MRTQGSPSRSISWPTGGSAHFCLVTVRYFWRHKESAKKVASAVGDDAGCKWHGVGDGCRPAGQCWQLEMKTLVADGVALGDTE